jgi:hypothetical protein
MSLKCLIAIYDGELRHDKWHPPLMEALRVLPLAERQHCERIRIERLGGVRIAEYNTADLRKFATARGYAVQPERRTVQDVDWELHRPFWPGATSDSTPRNKENDEHGTG